MADLQRARHSQPHPSSGGRLCWMRRMGSGSSGARGRRVRARGGQRARARRRGGQPLSRCCGGLAGGLLEQEWARPAGMAQKWVASGNSRNQAKCQNPDLDGCTEIQLTIPEIGELAL